MEDNVSAKSAWKEMLAVGVFVLVSLFAPAVVGELYPFTISPMFCDQPCQYCTYQLFDESGQELNLVEFGLHLVYDGNPPGLGMGIEPVERLHEFGDVPEIEEVAAHVKSKAATIENGWKQIRVRQLVVCCNGICPEREVREILVSMNQSEDQEAN